MRHYASRTYNYSGGSGYHFYCPHENRYYICNGQRVRYGYDNGVYCSSREERMPLKEFILIYEIQRCPFCKKDLLQEVSKKKN